MYILQDHNLKLNYDNKQRQMPLRSKHLLVLSILVISFLSNCSPNSHKDSLSKQADDTYRALLRQETQKRADLFNQLYGQHYQTGHNKFSSYSDQQFQKIALGSTISQQGSVFRIHVQSPTNQQKKTLKARVSTVNSQAQLPENCDPYEPRGVINGIIPTAFNVDYSKGPVLTTNVKDQGICGSSWAFAGIAEIESYFLKKHNLYLDLSEQQLIDCLPAQASINVGCGSGKIDAVGYYSTLFLVSQQRYYPYQAKTQTCNANAITQGGAYHINSYNYVKDCNTLLNVLLVNKPVAVCLTIDIQWKNYLGGVIPNCGQTTQGGHCVLLVGGMADGTTNVNTNYWKVKNSWGSNYGEKGYMRLYRDPSDITTGICGICKAGIYSS